MRLAVIADIHSNLAALEAVLADLHEVAPDQVVVAGDFINRGPQPAEVLAVLRECGWPLLRGNHEDYVLPQLKPFPVGHPQEPPGGWGHEMWQPARWTARQLPGEAEFLSNLPLTMTMEEPDGGAALIVHGSPRRNDEGVFTTTTDQQLREMLGPSPPRVFVCAHTHVPLVRHLGHTLVINTGAVGLPFNGDPRAHYALLTCHGDKWHAEVRTVHYDRQLTYNAFTTSGFLAHGGPLARVIYHEVETARPHLGPWVRHFQHDVQGGKISIAEAVARYFEML